MMKAIFIISMLVLLVYMLLPGPSSIQDFSGVPNAAKSTLDGDTVQVPNVVGYFSDSFRDVVIPFYVEDYQSKTAFPFSPIRLNYPPENAFNVIKKHTDSTFLEELVYPLRDSLYVNGFEPFYADGTPRYWGAVKVSNDGKTLYYTKTTLRFYPSSFWIKVSVWVGMVCSICLVWYMSKKVLNHG